MATFKSFFAAILGSLALLAPPGSAQPVSGDAALLARAAQADFVLLGEATHGTREFYLERARITDALAQTGGLRAVAIEGDWSGAERVNRYVRGEGTDRSATQALSDFEAFPAWMWRNAEFRDFVERLRAINAVRAPEQRIGVYGLDVYDVFDASAAVTRYLAREDPAAARSVSKAFGCFKPYGRSMEAYSLAVRRGRSCEAAAAEGLRAIKALPPPKPDQAEGRFAAAQAARAVVGGEEYWRVHQTTGYSWNARDRRMAASAQAVRAHVGGQVAIWAHNTHVGDARHTNMTERGEISLGQLLRDGRRTLLVGQLTHEGEVLAARNWDGPPRVSDVRPSITGSHEAALSATAAARQVLVGSDLPTGRRAPQRAIGVVYLPAQEREANWIAADLGKQFDAVIFTRRTTPVSALRG
ncbi:erythromycin esterase family protein [Phenylobacterium deserti]|uniref:Erythromycin esterase family protein n=1 Tax=Phenylobacterium deserti TaxID=1914756 RepID=A0A328ASI3_9CAUL|nr:erythromycin esterase family protein [Phenylobacterium deserti]RAK57221.1 erythromycin esterase family protein [Phenylobacterium deserti]